MKKIYDFLGILIGVCVGVFLGRVIYTFWEYKTFPGLYAMQSAPWYTSILVYGVFTAVSVTVMLLVRWVLRRMMRRKTANG